LAAKRCFSGRPDPVARSPPGAWCRTSSEQSILVFSHFLGEFRGLFPVEVREIRECSAKKVPIYWEFYGGRDRD
jgi:hypothetical protein